MQLTNLKTKYLGHDFKQYNEIDSTQEEIWRLIQNGKIKNGTVIISNIQTNGRGTHGRYWYTDEINNIAFSLYIETNCEPNKIDGITVEMAQILIDIFKEQYNICLNIKSPNDIVFNNKKIGGILTESKTNYGKVKYLVIGIGINTNKTRFVDDIKDIATSIKNEFDVEIDNKIIIEEFCNKFETAMEWRISK